MSPVFIDVMSMLGNWVSGVGAATAVIYAVNANKSGVKCYPCIHNKYSKSIKIELFNHKQVKSYITGIYIEFLDVGEFVDERVRNVESLNEHVDFCIDPGQRFSFLIEFDDLMLLYFNNVHWHRLNRVFNMPELKIVISLLNGKSKEVKLTESYYNDLLTGFIKHKEQSIMYPCRGNCYLVPSYEIGRSECEIVQNRINNYMECYNKLILLHPPRFKFTNKIRLLMAKGFACQAGN